MSEKLVSQEQPPRVMSATSHGVAVELLYSLQFQMRFIAVQSRAAGKSGTDDAALGLACLLEDWIERLWQVTEDLTDLPALESKEEAA